jgi:hypothetical protein
MGGTGGYRAIRSGLPAGVRHGGAALLDRPGLACACAIQWRGGQPVPGLLAPEICWPPGWILSLDDQSRLRQPCPGAIALEEGPWRGGLRGRISSQRTAGLLAECAPLWRLHRELNRATERGQPCGHPCGGTQIASFGAARMDSRLLGNARIAVLDQISVAVGYDGRSQAAV